MLLTRLSYKPGRRQSQRAKRRIALPKPPPTALTCVSYSPEPDIALLESALYRFEDPAVPGFILPAAGDWAPEEDVWLNVDNPIVDIDGSPTEAGCNGEIVSASAGDRRIVIAHWFWAPGGLPAPFAVAEDPPPRRVFSWRFSLPPAFCCAREET